jgi:tetratricopeptide (TPR) repeat protein
VLAALLLVLAISSPATEEQGVEALIARGESLMVEGRVYEAVGVLSRAVEAAPDSALAHLRLGGAYLLQRRYGSAAASFRRALAADPDNANAYVGLGIASLEQGLYGEGRRYLSEAKRLDPSKGGAVDRLLESLDENPLVPHGR